MSFVAWIFLFGAAAVAGPVLVHLLAKPENGPARGLLNSGPDDITLTMRFRGIPQCSVSAGAGFSSFDEDRQLITDPSEQATVVVVGCP